MGKRQIKIAESVLTKAVNEAISEYVADSAIDKPRYFGYDYTKHTDNPSQAQKDVDNDWSEKNAFSMFRNFGEPNCDFNPDDSDDSFYTNNSDLYSYPDENLNVINAYGYYGKQAQGDENDSSTQWARSQRTTPRQTSQAFQNVDNQGKRGKKMTDDSILDKIVSETIQRFLVKNMQNIDTKTHFQKA